LLEAVVAVAIVGAVGMAAMATIAAQNDVAFRTRRQIEATALAQYRLAEIGLADRNELIQYSNARRHFEPPFEDYAWTATVLPEGSESDLFDVIVRVEWEDERAVSLGTTYYRSAANAAP
jgi:type II secretory pathway pseudopilin PulG